MTTTKQLEQNVIRSFTEAREDIHKLYETMQFVLKELRTQRTRNAELTAQVAELGLRVSKVQYKAPKRKSTAAKKFVASRTSTKFHDKACVFAKNIKPKNKKVFTTKNAALNQGYKTCNCLAVA